MDAFVHLHVHSEYSLLDGACRIDELARAAANLGMRALALTDHGVMYGAIPFYKACRKAGVKPIIGLEAYVTNGALEERLPRREQKIYHLILLAENLTGYRNLLKIASTAHLQGFYYKPRVNKEILRRYSEGIIALSACMSGEVARLLLGGQYEAAKRAALEYQEIFGAGKFYLELQDHGLEEEKRINREMVRLSGETGIPLVATNDVHYVHKEDAYVHDVLLCIGTGKTIDDEERMRFPSNQFYLKSAGEMAALFRYAPEAIANTARIAEKCNVELSFGAAILPRYNVPHGKSADSYLRELCEAGLRQRYRDISPEIRGRLEEELSVISRMGYSDYFLIVWDFVKYAREKGISVGPGRGSAAGSLVAYVLGITDVDPLRYGLLFERFLNPERVSMPDIDIDFSDDRRDEVIDYVVRKYGKEHVAQIITFGTMAARAAVRDVGRVLNLPYSFVDKVAKMIPPGPGMTIEQALVLNPELNALCRTDERVRRLLDTAKKVEGMPRNASTHAAGVVISRDPLTEHVALQEGNAGCALTQYPMEVLEEIGLLKMDFLGLRNLTIIDLTLENIERATGKKLELARIPLDDANTYRLLGRGDTTGIFQLESEGMRKVLRELQPTKLEDLIATLALYRPGPMEIIPRFIAAKHGKEKIAYLHPDLEPILKETYGFIVYQEQIMQIAAKMAGFSLGEADILRRAVGKKKKELLEEQRERFVAGCVKQGYGERLGQELYDWIVRFADYGFNKSHSTAYALIAYQMAYLKANFPLAFMAALLSMAMGNHQKIAEYIEECRKMGIPVLPPDINESEATFAVKHGAIRFGLAGIKNVGTHALKAILHARQKGKFTSLFDFCLRVDTKACNKRVIEALIQCGAMDGLQGHRAQLLAVLDQVLEIAAQRKKEREDGQIDLFSSPLKTGEDSDGERGDAASLAGISYPPIPPYSHKEQLELERELLGVFVSGHPLDDYEPVLRHPSVTPLAQVGERAEGEDVRVAGIVRDVKHITTKKGEPMAFLTVEDKTKQMEVVVFPRTYHEHRPLLFRERLILLQGRVSRDEEGAKLIAGRFWDLTQIAQAMSKERPESGGRKSPGRPGVYVKIAPAHEDKRLLSRLRALLQRYPGRYPVYLYYERKRQLKELSAKYRVEPSPAFLAQAEHLLGKGSVVVKGDE